MSLPFIKNGRVKGIAVSSDKRLASLPNVPTFAESGLLGAEAVTFTGLLAPTGTPEAIILRLSEAIKKVVSNPVIIKRFDEMGAEAKFMTPKEFGNYLANEDAKWLPIIKQANIKAN